MGAVCAVPDGSHPAAIFQLSRVKNMPILFFLQKIFLFRVFVYLCRIRFSHSRRIAHMDKRRERSGRKPAATPQYTPEKARPFLSLNLNIHCPMIQRKTRLMAICEEIAAPFTTDQEGKLRGGFGGFGGASIMSTLNSPCENTGCKNENCTNSEGCVNDGCKNDSCSNGGCKNKTCTVAEPSTTTTTTDKPNSVAPSGFLLF